LLDFPRVQNEFCTLYRLKLTSFQENGTISLYATAI